MQFESDTPTPDILWRYLAGDATPAERDAMALWLVEHPGEELRLLAIRDKAKAAYGPVPRYDVDIRVSAILDYSRRTERRTHREAEALRILATQRPGRFHALQQTWRGVAGSPRWSVVGGLAAVCAIMLIGGTIRWSPFGHRSTTAVSTYSTGNGERATITLPDRSVVVLNVASQLEIPADYDRGNRTLRLRGEALFTVTHAAGHPFTVVAGPSTTRVLGTSFLVRHYSSDSTATIAVRDGKVVVGTRVLTALQQVTVDNHGERAVAAADPARFEFGDRKLSLDYMPLRQAVPELNRWYDADIRIGDPRLDTLNITGDFQPGVVKDLAAILELTLNVRVVREQRTLTLYPK